MADIKKIPLSHGKRQLRYKGIAMSPAEKIAILKINELIEAHNKDQKRTQAEIARLRTRSN